MQNDDDDKRMRKEGWKASDQQSSSNDCEERGQLVRLRLTLPLAVGAASDFEKYSSEPTGSGFMVAEPSLQFAGQTSPCLSYRQYAAW